MFLFSKPKPIGQEQGLNFDHEYTLKPNPILFHGSMRYIS